VTIAHDVTGVFTILDDCTWAIDDFEYDGLGPDAFVYFSAQRSTLASGLFDEGDMLERAYSGECLMGQLPGEATFSEDVSTTSIVASIWCRRFSANFGDVQLNASSAEIAEPAPACFSSKGCPDRLGTDCLANCVHFSDTFNVWYELNENETMITVELETVTENEDAYLAFGPADPDSSSVRMVGSDVAIVGVRGGEGFALDYHLNQYSMCDYSSTASKGACPDPSPCSDDLTLVSSEREGSVTRVRYTRPVAAGDACDHPFAPPGSFTSVVFTTGQVTGDDGHAPNVSNVVVNKHGRTPSVGFRLDVGATPGPWACKATPTLPVDPDAPLTTAQCPLSLVELDPTVDHVITISSYTVHPQPPGWGIVFAVDGEPTPELVVRRGSTYTFAVGASKEHPFYVTDSVVGGAVDDLETIFAGGPASFGTEAAPTTVTWTVGVDTPDLVFYQCVTHQRLGWRIYVRDGDADLALPDDTQTVGVRAAACDEASGGDEDDDGSGEGEEGGPLGRVCEPGPFAGRSASLTTRAHRVSGTVTIIDDCTYAFDGLSYDGEGPDVFVYVAADLAGLEEEDVVFDADARITRAFDDECLVAQLPADATFSDISTSEVVLSLWCRAFAANFGEAVVKASSAGDSVSQCFEEGEGVTGLDGASSVVVHAMVATCALAAAAL
jgi:hypothetical protein